MRFTNLMLLVALLFSGSLQAQEFSVDLKNKADSKYEHFAYATAVKYYEEALPGSNDSLYVLQQLGNCYRFLNDPEKAEYWFAQVVQYDNVDPIYEYYYAQALLSNQKLDEAKKWYSNYVTDTGDERAHQKLRSISSLGNLYADSARYEVSRLEINSTGLDFSPTYYKEGIVFVSSRSLHKIWIKNEFTWDESRFLDLFYADINTGEVAYFDERQLNTKYHEGPVAFYNDQQNIIFTRSSYFKRKIAKDTSGTINLKLFFGTYNPKSDDWEDVVPYEHNDKDWSTAHPTVDPSGKYLYFSSTRPGGQGDADLYLSIREGDSWSSPQNLGAKINTEGKEMFPFLKGDTLYFASDGLGGLGGFDIYYSVLKNNFPVSEPVNLGYPINSNRDDFGLVLNEQGTQGYFSSARIDSLKDDIYQFKYFPPEYITVPGLVISNEDSSKLPKADVFVSANGVKSYTRANDEGLFSAKFPIGARVTFSSAFFNYVLDTSVSYQGQDTVFLMMNPLDKKPQTFPEGTLSSLLDSAISEDTHRTILSEMPEAIDHSIGAIYYDLNKFDIRNDAIETLEVVVQVMNLFPDLKIEIASHTDIRASSTYNEQLSGQRSRAVFDYLSKKGIDPARLVMKAYGESQLDVKCPCSEKDHQLNRRTEFIILNDPSE